MTSPALPPTDVAARQWGICANYVGPRILRWGAKVRLVDAQWPDRVKVVGLNHWGREVETWVAGKWLHSFRPVYVHGGIPPLRWGFSTKADAQEKADGWHRARESFWRCPLMTWAETRAACPR